VAKLATAAEADRPVKAPAVDVERCAANTICPSWCPDPRCHFRGKFEYRGRRYCRKHYAIAQRQPTDPRLPRYVVRLTAATSAARTSTARELTAPTDAPSV
jgi:hypothetical protein